MCVCVRGGGVILHPHQTMKHIDGKETAAEQQKGKRWWGRKIPAEWAAIWWKTQTAGKEKETEEKGSLTCSVA